MSGALSAETIHAQSDRRSMRAPPNTQQRADLTTDVFRYASSERCDHLQKTTKSISQDGITRAASNPQQAATRHHEISFPASLASTYDALIICRGAGHSESRVRTWMASRGDSGDSRDMNVRHDQTSQVCFRVFSRSEMAVSMYRVPSEQLQTVSGGPCLAPVDAP